MARFYSAVDTARGGIVIAVTDTLLSPMASFARVTIETPQRLPVITHSQVAAACILQALAIAVSETRPKDDQQASSPRSVPTSG